MAGARSMWKGVIQLGLLTIPVKLYSGIATEEKLSFNMLHLCGQRVTMPTVCPTHGPIERVFTRSGYNVGGDNYVMLEDSDFDAIPLPSKNTIHIERFVDMDNALLHQRQKQVYYLAPEEVGKMPYAVICEAMRQRRVVGIAKISIRSREQVAAIAVDDVNRLSLTTLYWSDELRDPDTLVDPVKVEVNAALLSAADSLISSLTGIFDPADYTDGYKAAVLSVIADKQAGVVPTAPTEPVVSQIDTLMATLQASLTEARTEAAAPTPRAKRGVVTP